MVHDTESLAPRLGVVSFSNDIYRVFVIARNLQVSGIGDVRQMAAQLVHRPVSGAIDRAESRKTTIGAALADAGEISLQHGPRILTGERERENAAISERAFHRHFAKVDSNQLRGDAQAQPDPLAVRLCARSRL